MYTVPRFAEGVSVPTSASINTSTTAAQLGRPYVMKRIKQRRQSQK
jgi:hypothetical protein